MSSITSAMTRYQAALGVQAQAMGLQQQMAEQLLAGMGAAPSAAQRPLAPDMASISVDAKALLAAELLAEAPVEP